MWDNNPCIDAVKEQSNFRGGNTNSWVSSLLLEQYTMTTNFNVELKAEHQCAFQKKYKAKIKSFAPQSVKQI